MRLSFLTTILYALAVSGAPLAGTEVSETEALNIAKANELGRSVLNAIPHLQAVVTSRPDVGAKIAANNPSFHAADGSLDIQKINTAATALANAAPGQSISDLAGALGTVGSLATGLASGIYDGVAGILSTEWSIISGIGSYLWSWVPSFGIKSG